MSDYADLKAAATYAAQDAIKFSDESEEMRALQQFHEEVDPETILALIAENEQLAKTADCWDRLNVQNKALSDSFRAERDQLKAENEALRSDIQSWRLSIEAERNVHKLSLKGVQDELDRLTGPSFTEELAALRKGAVRYEWLRDKQTFIWLIQDWFPNDAEFTDVDAVIDAAMGEGGAL